tara:strand:- start:1327 stop:1587 length:261 start_codon:yes stop_codon:yes gene_type:complete
MIEWIKSFFVSEKKQPSRPKCCICGLGASHFMLVEFKKIDLTDVENKILIKICSGCYEEVYERYNPDRRPPFIQKGVFESQLGFRK